MELFDAIQTRRTIGKVTQEPISREQIEKLLEAAAYAPNHYLTKPWRFYVFEGEGRKVLGDLYRRHARETSSDPQADHEQLEAQYKKAFRAPVIIGVSVLPSSQPKVIELEEICSVASAIQNMLLTAHDLGLGAIWRTGEFAYHDILKEGLNFKEEERMLGLIYVGHPANEETAKSKKAAAYEDKVKWYQ